VKNFLLIKLGAIGDVVQAAAAVEQMRSVDTEVSFDWVIGSGVANLLDKMEVAERVIPIDDNPLFSGSFIQKLVGLFASWKVIFQNSRKYERVYIAHTSWLYSLLAVPIYFRNPRLILRRSKRFHPKLNAYRVTEYFSFLTGGPLTIPEGSRALQRLGERLLVGNSVAAEKLMARIDPAKKCIALIPGGSKNNFRDDFLRRWPINAYVQLAESLMEQGYQVVLLGGEGDVWVEPYFSKTSAINLIGKTTLLELVRIIAKVNVMVCHDTGPLHLATLTQTPLLSLFGPTPASAVVPIGRKDLQIFTAKPEITCAPCYDGKNYAACNDPVCMKSINVQGVFNSVIHLLDKK